LQTEGGFIKIFNDKLFWGCFRAKEQGLRMQFISKLGTTLVNSIEENQYTLGDIITNIEEFDDSEHKMFPIKITQPNFLYPDKRTLLVKAKPAWEKQKKLGNI